MQKLCLNNNCYNVIHQLTKTLGFLSHVDTYIEDARKTGNDEAEKVWQTIKTDRERHADLLRGIVASEVKNNRF
ncbi:MAG: hypothetical protein WD154_02420 [Nitrosopumilaceae archaeon]